MDKQNKSTDKLTEKAFSRLMLTSVLGILVCIMCLCSATWAWFSADVSNNSNTLGSGQFDLDVSVEDSSSDTISIVEGADGQAGCTFEEAGVYTVTLKMTEDTTVTKGFCTINAGGESYCTASINVDGTNPFTFTLNVKEAGMAVTFAPAWGLPVEADVELGGTLQIDSAEKSDK